MTREKLTAVFHTSRSLEHADRQIANDGQCANSQTKWQHDCEFHIRIMRPDGGENNDHDEAAKNTLPRLSRTDARSQFDPAKLLASKVGTDIL